VPADRRKKKKKTKVEKELADFVVMEPVKEETKKKEDMDYEEFRATLQKGPLFNVIWHRIILDEAHIIKNHNSRGSMACAELKATYRWCLTGIISLPNCKEHLSKIK
jgi:SNF2 family DNA or RNA helicase